MHSALYKGWVRHDRRQPRRHRFAYPLTLFYIDLDELPDLDCKYGIHTQKRWRLLRFRREDYLTPTHLPLKTAVLDLVETKLGIRPNGPIRLLANLRTFGLCFNPVSFYYCFNQAETLEAIVAEINNTPWDERYCYVLPATNASKNHRYKLAKDFHVSPFMPMNIDYDWRFGLPGQKLWVNMANHLEGDKVFSVALALQHEPITAKAIRSTLWRVPGQTYRILAAIYWQALKLWFKRIPFYNHPKHRKTAEGDAS